MACTLEATTSKTGGELEKTPEVRVARNGDLDARIRHVEKTVPRLDYAAGGDR